jgi:hypothetical protein
MGLHLGLPLQNMLQDEGNQNMTLTQAQVDHLLAIMEIKVMQATLAQRAPRLSVRELLKAYKVFEDDVAEHVAALLELPR